MKNAKSCFNCSDGPGEQNVERLFPYVTVQIQRHNQSTSFSSIVLPCTRKSDKRLTFRRNRRRRLSKNCRSNNTQRKCAKSQCFQTIPSPRRHRFSSDLHHEMSSDSAPDHSRHRFLEEKKKPSWSECYKCEKETFLKMTTYDAPCHDFASINQREGKKKGRKDGYEYVICFSKHNEPKNFAMNRTQLAKDHHGGSIPYVARYGLLMTITVV